MNLENGNALCTVAQAAIEAMHEKHAVQAICPLCGMESEVAESRFVSVAATT
jgi:predicted RNA-binding Zn-ribbon protein involved in translation (DUF1610 family)